MMMPEWSPLKFIKFSLSSDLMDCVNECDNTRFTSQGHRAGFSAHSS